jgi:hypothetical protein
MKTLALVVAATVLQPDTARVQAAPQISFEVLETSPPSPATLHRGDHLYVRIRYETNTPMWIEGRYSYQGSPADQARTSGAGLVAPGKGELLIWASFVARAGVDAIDLVAYANGGRNSPARQHLTVDFTWDGQPTAGETHAPWVAPLLAEEQARQQKAFADMERQFYQPGSGGFGVAGVGLVSIVGLLALVVVVGGFVWPIYGTIRWRGAWRIAAAAPLAAGVLWTLKDAYDLVLDSTSHNLLPFEYVIGAAVTVPYMILVSIWRKMVVGR